MQLKKKVLIVTEYFYPRNRPDSYLITEISRAINEATLGNIKIICNSELKMDKELDFVEEKIIRLHENRLNNDKLFFRMIKFIISTIQLSFTTFKSLKSGDELFTVTNPAFLLVVFALFKRIKKFHYTLLVYDVFPENLIAVGLVKPNSMLYKITKKIFDWAYSQTDLLVVIGRDMQELIANKTHNKVPLKLISNWCDVETVIPSPKSNNTIIQKFNLEEKIVFSFTGNFGRAQGIERLLKIASLVSNSDFKLLFIGDGAMRPLIEQYIKENPNGNVLYAGVYPSSEQNIFLNACDVALISLDNNMYGLGVPSKSYYNMAARKPLLFIGHQDSEIAQVITENQIGWCCYSADNKDIATTIDRICAQKDDFITLGDKSRQIVTEKFSKPVVLEKYKKLYLNKANT